MDNKSLKTTNDYANFWYQKGLNVIPFDTKEGAPIIEKYTQYQNKRIPYEIFRVWIMEKKFERGLAIFPGKIYSNDSSKDLYLVALDFDEMEGLNEFCTYNGKYTSVKEFAEKTIVEGHEDEPHSIHIYFLSPIPFPNKGPDKIIGLEVKSRGEHGIMFCSNSPHKNGYRYQILGTSEPTVLTYQQAIEMIQHFNNICLKHNLNYLDNKSRIDPKLRKMIKLLKLKKNIDSVIYQGERHNRLISIGNSILFNHLNEDLQNVDELYKFFIEINKMFCSPEVSTEEIDSIWNSCLTFVTANKDFKRDIESSNSHKESQQDFIENATEMILENNYFVTFKDSKEIFYYQNGAYVSGGEIIIEQDAERLFGYNLANKHLSEIKGHIMRKTYHERGGFDNNLNVINLRNGLYYIDENILKPHSPDYFSVNQIPVMYDPVQKPKLFWEFLKDVLYPTDLRTSVEAMAYTFYRDYPFEYYFKLFGYGSNGKSVFTALLTAIHGSKNVSNASVKALIDNRFALADLEFKNVNIDSEYSDISIKDTSILKKLTAGRKQPTRIERKNQHAYDAILYAKLFFNANSLNEQVEKTDADYRREVIITFPNTFEGNKDDPQLLQKLVKQEELSGIFNVLMVALRRILKNRGVYINEKTIEERRKKAERVADPIKSFLEDAVADDSDESDWIAKSDFHNAYTKYCKRHKIAIKPIEIFAKDLAKIKKFHHQKKTINGERKMGWLGIKLMSHYLICEEQRLLLDSC
jgi:putative DNA primase/helicase